MNEEQQNQAQQEQEEMRELLRIRRDKLEALRAAGADPFAITKRDISPLLKELERRNIPLTQDLIGRIFFSYVQKGTFVHGVSLGHPLNG